jgi:hypothetical protein
MSDFTFTKEIFVHDFLNPPTRSSFTNWTLNLVKSNGDIEFNNIQTGRGQTRLSLEVKRPSRIGFTSDKPRIVEFEIKNLILSFNLSLEDTCMTYDRREYSPAQVQLKPREQKSTIKQQNGKTSITINEEIGNRESVIVALGKTEEVKEQNVVDNFQKIQGLNREGLQPLSPTSQLNLDRALSEFGEAMSAPNTIFKFKHIYNAIEFATNANGIRGMQGDTLDKEVCNLTKNVVSNPPDPTLVSDWRRFYNRLKHPDENNNNTITYEQGIRDLPSWLPRVRTCAVAILLQRLDKP